jgi:hypothetical protein
MKAVARVALVAAGYAAAVGVAFLVTNIYIRMTSDVDRQLYSGMSAFGDSLVFLGAFAVAAVPATGIALYFLRPLSRVWGILGIGALVFASSAVIACLLQLAGRTGALGSTIAAWSAVAPLRILVAPLFALLFFLCGLVAPSRRPRLMLLLAGAMEAASFTVVAFTWFLGR